MYWSGVSLNSFTTCSNDVTVGTTGPIGSGLPQFGFPRRFAIFIDTSLKLISALRMRTLGKYRSIHSKAVMVKKQGEAEASLATDLPYSARNSNPS
jgi:hypothetical protein